MKNIFCYGDSNTFGLNPKDHSRYIDTNWTALLQKNLGPEYQVINEGMPNRTGFVNNPDGVLYSSQKHFPKALFKIDNVDIIILAVGTNDLMFKYKINNEIIENGLNNLIKISKGKTNNIIIIPPTIPNKNICSGYFGSMFDESSISKAKIFGNIFEQTVLKNKCIYFDINKIAVPSDIDGLHYDESSHKIIADKLSELIKNNNS